MRKHSYSLKNILGWASTIAIFAFTAPVHAQQNVPRTPYASIGSKGVSYAGPGRTAAYNLRGPVVRIGLLAPMHGPEKADGEAIVRAAQMAVKDETARPLPSGLRLELAVGDESGPAWNQVTSAILQLIFKDHAVAIVTSASGVATHLSEQAGNKIGVPVLTLSSDTTATEINLPWIFRLGPSDAQQARAIARSIYHQRGFRRVLLVAGRDHDGRMGNHEFVKAARRLGAPAPASMTINPLKPESDELVAAMRASSPQAIVLWIQPETARTLVRASRTGAIHAPIYLSQETAQKGSGLVPVPPNSASIKDPRKSDFFTVSSGMTETLSGESFSRRYELATGAPPSAVAAEAYDAVRLVAQAVREVGPNRARVRDRISNTRNFAGASGKITFDDQGNNLSKIRLVHLQVRCCHRD